MLTAHELMLDKPPHGLDIEGRRCQLHEFMRQHPAEIARQFDADEIIQAVTNFAPLARLRPAPITAREGTDGAQLRIVAQAAKQGGNDLGVVASRATRSKPQRRQSVTTLCD